MPLDLVIFDCDGVLIDSEALSHGIEAALFRELGIDIDADTYIRRFAGYLIRDIVPVLQAEHDVPLPPAPEIGAELAARVMPVFERELMPVDGIPDLLPQLRHPLAVASSSSPARLAMTLGMTGLASFFDDRVFSVKMVALAKPAPDVFLHAARTLGASPSRCLVIEDSPPGVRAAVAAGMITVGFTAGRHIDDKDAHAARLSALGADYIAARASDIADIVAERG